MHGWLNNRSTVGPPPIFVQGPVMLDKLDKALSSRRKPSRSVNDKSRPKSRRPRQVAWQRLVRRPERSVETLRRHGSTYAFSFCFATL